MYFTYFTFAGVRAGSSAEDAKDFLMPMPMPMPIPNANAMHARQVSQESKT